MNSTGNAAPDNPPPTNSLADAVSRWWRKFPPGFRQRRGLNWFILGATYASYYMCRYNFRFATPGRIEESGFSKTEITDIPRAWPIAYGPVQLLKARLKDRIGAKAPIRIA